MMKICVMAICMIPLMVCAQTPEVNGVKWSHSLSVDVVAGVGERVWHVNDERFADGGPYTARVGGEEWEFAVKNGVASIVGVRSAISAVVEGRIVLPSSLGGCPVADIEDCAFEYCRALTSVTIPEGVTNIGNYAFSQCSGLTSVTIPAGVTNIGADAFYGCRSLREVTIPEGVMGIKESTFYGCIGLMSVTIPSTLKYISDYAFYGCSGLTGVAIPRGVTGIGFLAFWGGAAD